MRQLVAKISSTLLCNFSAGEQLLDSHPFHPTHNNGMDHKGSDVPSRQNRITAGIVLLKIDHDKRNFGLCMYYISQGTTGCGNISSVNLSDKGIQEFF